MHHVLKNLASKLLGFLKESYDPASMCCFVLSLLPIIGVLSFPIDTLGKDWTSLSVVAVLVGLPILIVTSFLVRKLRILVLPLYILETVGMVWFSYTFLATDTHLQEVLRFLLLSGFVSLGFFLLKPDVAEVLLNKDRNNFRKNKRVHFGQTIDCCLLNDDVFTEQFHATLNNVSMRGLGMTFLKKDLDHNFVWLHEKEEIQINALVDGNWILITCTIMWIRQEEKTVAVGLFIQDESNIQKIFDIAAAKNQKNTYSEKIVKVCNNPITQKAVAAFWAVGTLFSVGAPSCQRAEVVGIQKNALTSEDRVPVQIDIDSSTGLQLIDNSNQISLSIENCISGLSQTFEYGLDEVTLYAGDKNCSVKLNSFYVDTEFFAIDPNTTWNPTIGALNSFIGNEGSTAQVFVIQQLPATLDTGAQVSFSVNQIKDGSDFLADLQSNVIFLEALTPDIEEGTDSTASFRFLKVAEADSNALDIHYTIDANGILAGDDYIAPSGTVTIPAGQTEVVLDIDIVDDTIAEALELLVVRITTDANYYHYGLGGALITDDDENIVQTGLAMHLDQTGIVTSGSSVTNWNDLTAQSNDGFQTTSSAQPQLATGILAGHDGIVFDGVDDIIRFNDSDDINTASVSDHKTQFIVFRTGTDVSTRQMIYEQGGSSRGLNFYIDQGLLFINGWNVPADDANPWNPSFVTSPVAADTLYLATLEFNSVAGKIKGYMNGSFVGEVTGVGRLFGHSDDIGIGAVNGGTHYHDNANGSTGDHFSGAVGEFLNYNGEMTSAERQAVLNSLTQKYSLQAPVVNMTFTTASETEGQGATGYIRVTRSYPAAIPLDVQITISGSATNGSDYSTIATTLTLPAYSLQTDFPFSIIDDTEEEMNEYIIADLVEAPNDYTLGTSSASFMIADDDSFTPPANSVLWLRADTDVTLVTGNVSVWGDQSSENQNIFQTTASARPSVNATGINGMPAIEFSGTEQLQVDNDGFLNLATAANYKQWFVAFKTSSDITTRQIIYEQGGGVRGAGLYIDNGELYTNFYHNTASSGYATWSPVHVKTPISANTEYVVTITFDAPGDSLAMRLNGQPVGSASGVDVLNSHSGAIAISGIRSNYVIHNNSKISSGAHFQGMIGEFLYYNEILPSQDMLDVEGYLTNKYVP